MAATAIAMTPPETERLRKWIMKYNIFFEGPLPAHKWPPQYESIFRSIRDIDRIRFDEYGPNENRGLLSVAQIKERVVSINDVAYTCRQNRVNEQTWRLKIEHWILWRFDAEVACHKCRKRLWISEVQTLPEDPDRADELRSRRAKRVLCTCSLSDRAMVDRWARGQTRVFADRAEDFVLHQDSMELLGCGVKERKPDRIFGLENTTLFDRYTSAEESIRHSPFADGRILYPFLIIEAKSEKGSPGFESIESQTAFPIRTLLQLQDKLSTYSGIRTNPLLWFLANQGDEWRVYAAVVHNSQFRIFDLWHGTILSQDCALQLLLIIDGICEWARDIYRLDVLRCLSRGQLDLRAITPALSTSQSQNGIEKGPDIRFSDSAAGPPTPQLETAPQLEPSRIPALDELIPDLDTTMTDADTSVEDVSLIKPDEVGNRHTYFRYDKRHPTAPVWTTTATIQHSNLVKFTFRHYTVPEDLGPLRQLLKIAYRTDDLTLSARAILSLFESHSAIQTDMTAITELVELWIGDADLLFRGTRKASNRSVQARVAFQTFFDVASWETTRLLECFICSQKAWNLLLQMSRYENPPTRDPWMSDHRNDLLADVMPLRHLNGKASITAALSKLELQLCDSHTPSALTPNHAWEEIDRFPVEDLFDCRDNLAEAEMLQQYSRRSTMQRELLSATFGPSWLDSLLQTRSMQAEQGAVLLRKPPTWPEDCPFFCLAVFNPDIDFEYEQGLGRILDKVFKDKDIYVVTDGETKARPLSDVDRQGIVLWSKILQRSLPADTPWPMLL